MIAKSYFVAKGRSADAVAAFEKRMEDALTAWLTFTHMFKTDQFIAMDGKLYALKLADPLPPGWRRDSVLSLDYAVLAKRTKEGKAFSKLVNSLPTVPRVPEIALSIGFTDNDPVVVDGRWYDSMAYEKIGDTVILEVRHLDTEPAKVPWDAEPILKSGVELLREAQPPKG